MQKATSNKATELLINMITLVTMATNLPKNNLATL